MKIISWNCNRAFRNKYKKVLKYNADISGYVPATICDIINKIKSNG